MKSTFLSLLAITAALALPTFAHAQSAGSVNEAFQVARTAVKPELQTKVVSVYGIGTPTTIQKWYIIFYDPSVASHGRAVLVENKAVTRTYEANGGVTYDSSLTFDPARITNEGAALDAAAAYASKHKIAYDSITALLRQTSASKPFCWKIGLVDNGEKKGYVNVRALDNTFVSYETANAKHLTSKATEDSAKGFGDDVKHTFLGIGGDLQEFFTGERTVDK